MSISPSKCRSQWTSLMDSCERRAYFWVGEIHRELVGSR
jgi:hypothetical protein